MGCAFGGSPYALGEMIYGSGYSNNFFKFDINLKR